MSKYILALLLVFVSGNLWAGKLDIDYITPSPTKAFMYSLFIPGAGYFYLSGQTVGVKGVKWQGLKFLVLGAASYYFVANNIFHGKTGAALTSAAVVLSLKLWEFDSVIGAAEAEKWKKFKEYERARTKETEDKGASGGPEVKHSYLRPGRASINPALPAVPISRSIL